MGRLVYVAIILALLVAAPAIAQQSLRNTSWVYQAAMCYDVQLLAWGSGNDLVAARWTFANSGRPLVLRGNDGDRLELILRDDFTGLISQTFMIQGVLD